MRPSSGVSIPAMHFSVMLLPQPEAPRMPMRRDSLWNSMSSRKLSSFFRIFTLTGMPYHLLIFFIFLPEIRFMRTTTANAMTMTTATQIPAVR